MLKKFIKPSFSKVKLYSQIILNQLLEFSEKPLFYFKEFLNIYKSFLISVISKYSAISIINRKINGINFIFDFRLDPQILNMYLGIYQTQIIKVLLKHLKKGDVFIDVGANIGYLSALGAGLVGKEGEVHSFEPVSVYFDKLSKMVKLNENYKIYLNNVALGDKSSISKINITNLDNIGWNTMVPGMMRPQTIKKKNKVNVVRLDEYLFKKNIDNISLIKIDVEGFEFPVLKGLSHYFKNKNTNLPPIIVEIAPSAYPLLGFELAFLENFMKKYSYYAFSPNEKYRIDIKKLVKTTDVLFKQV